MATKRRLTLSLLLAALLALAPAIGHSAVSANPTPPPDGCVEVNAASDVWDGATVCTP